MRKSSRKSQSKKTGKLFAVLLPFLILLLLLAGFLFRGSFFSFNNRHSQAEEQNQNQKLSQTPEQSQNQEREAHPTPKQYIEPQQTGVQRQTSGQPQTEEQQQSGVQTQPDGKQPDVQTQLNKQQQQSDVQYQSDEQIRSDVHSQSADILSGLTAYFLDVEQGDAALFICDGHSMLVDGGGSDKSSYLYSFLQQHNISHLDYAVASHPGEDHVGGMAGALNYATADHVYCNYTRYDTRTFNSFVKYAETGDTKIEVPAVGTTFSLGSAEVTVLGPYCHDDNSSLVLKLVYGDVSFLLTGDSEKNDELALLQHNVDQHNAEQHNTDLKCTVLKVAHHGSSTSTTQEFLNAAAPEYAVISVGGYNNYGHPERDVLERLQASGAALYRTDMNGIITFTTDGKTVNVETEKTGNYAPFYIAGGYNMFLENVEALASASGTQETYANSDAAGTDAAGAGTADSTDNVVGTDTAAGADIADGTDTASVSNTTTTTNPTITDTSTADTNAAAAANAAASSFPSSDPSSGLSSAASSAAVPQDYVANKNTKKFHYPNCSSAEDMKESNKWYYTGTREDLIQQGYKPCKRCNP